MAKITEEQLEIYKKLTDLSGIAKSDFIDKASKGTRRTEEGFLPYSNYSITLNAFNRDELINLQSLIRRDELYRLETYKIIHSHIEETSLGKLSLEQFLQNTSFLDLDTLSYMMYMATFRDKGTYTFNCLNVDCELPIDVKLNNSSLIKLKNADEYKRMSDESLLKELDLKGLQQEEDFFVNKKTFLQLDESGFIVVMREPSLGEDAWSLRLSKNKELKNDADLLGALECITEFHVIAEDKTSIVLTKKEDILKELVKLSFYDQKEIIEEAHNILFNNLIEYTIDEVTCPHCGEKYMNLPISMSNVLFYLIYAEV